MTILVSYKHSRLEQLRRDGDDDIFARLEADGNLAIERFRDADDRHRRSLASIREHLAGLGLPWRAAFRGDVGPRLDDDVTLLITVGGDGTVLDMSHRVDRVPILAINSDPRSSVGYFCAGSAEAFPALLERTLSEAWLPSELYRFRIRIDGALCPEPVLNDVLIAHENPAAVSRYILRIDQHEEEHKSSGIWLATPAGSTAAIRSAGGTVLPMTDRNVQYLVREPYPPPRGHYRLTHGVRPTDERFEVISKMDEGCLYLDGPHISYPLGLGASLTVDHDAPPLALYGLDADRRAI